MEEGFAIWANPSSPHAEGRKAKAALEDARERCKNALGWEGELIFTSGASEAAALALVHANAGARLVSLVEHDCILGTVPDAENLPMGRNGAPDLEILAEAVDRERPLVAVQHVNSETGTIQDYAQIAPIVAGASGLSLADCAQSAGKLAIPLLADMAILSAHKFGGPIGVGALLVKDFAMLKPSGGHERGYRRGTENLPDVMGMAAALENSDWATLPDERAAFLGKFDGMRQVIGEQVDYILPLMHPTMSAQALLIRLDAMGFAVSAGSACSSGSMKPSRVLQAFGLDADTARRTIRVSLGWNTTSEELDAFAAAWSSLG
ncbi:aminotransferase [Aurantiacibacter marinus]|uniref:Cysteine desulfurase n=2 Tax=Aurantiacibacter marinus TaxID=874156 RepID=A0A0H0XLC9_9SPHN|nr:aminotransferase [Aurantiacibacter marinus]